MIPTMEAKQKKKEKKAGGKRRRTIRIVLISLLVTFVAATILSAVGYQTYSSTYHQSLLVAQTGVQHLRKAQTLLAALPRHPLDPQSVNQAQQEFTLASTDFIQLDHTIQGLPGIATSLPVYGTRLRAASHLIPFALSVSQAGIASCKILALLITRFQNPLGNQGHDLATADLTFINQDFKQAKAAFNLAVTQINQVQLADVQFDPSLSKMVASFRGEIPALQARINDAEKLLTVAPTLLGIGTPTNYLIEELDSTELRPGGGYIGSYGIATFSGGHLTAAHVTDSNLLDRPFEIAGKKIPYPPAYSWFDLAPGSWSFRDSNLDMDFPTAARYGEQIYVQEGGKIPVQGVIAITPALMQQVLAISGPIYIPEYKETVTAQNLIARIHYHQLDPRAYEGSDQVPAPDGNSSLRKHFEAILLEHLLERFRQPSSSDFPKFLQLLTNSMHSRDLQIYLNPKAAEDLLHQYHLDGTVQSPIGDGLIVVDANISPNKANSFIVNTLNDQVTLDSEGNVFHHTTLNYAWTMAGPVYGPALYRDYVRVYVPPGGTLQTQDGWQPRGTSESFGYTVWAGFFTLNQGQTRTITLTWKIAHVVKRDTQGWNYQYLIQRQPGAKWKLNLQVTLPSCAMIKNEWGGFVSGTNKQLVTLSQSLTENMTMGMDYTCH